MSPKLRKLIDEFTAEFFWLAFPEEAKNRCIDMSIEVLRRYGVPSAEMHKHMGDNVGRVDSETVPEHHWVILEDYNIDFTARQMKPSADFPKIWRV